MKVGNKCILLWTFLLLRIIDLLIGVQALATNNNSTTRYKYSVCNGLSNQLLQHAAAIADYIEHRDKYDTIIIPNNFIINGVQSGSDNVYPNEQNSIPLNIIFDMEYFQTSISKKFGVDLILADFDDQNDVACTDWLGVLTGANDETVMEILELIHPAPAVQVLINMTKSKFPGSTDDGVCVHNRNGRDWFDHCKRWEAIDDGIWRKNCLLDEELTFPSKTLTRALNLRDISKDNGNWLYYIDDYDDIPYELKRNMKVVRRTSLIPNLESILPESITKYLPKNPSSSNARDFYALLDFMLCSELTQFVGNSVSSFSALQLAWRRHNDGNYWYNSFSIPLSMHLEVYSIPIVYTYTEMSEGTGKDMLKASILSVRQHMPRARVHIIYHGSEDQDFQNWLKYLNVEIHDHNPSWKEEIEKMRLAGDTSKSHLFLHEGNYFGTWQRIDIPHFIKSEYCLLLDADTIVTAPFTMRDFGLELTRSIALSSEFDANSNVPWNAGIALMHIPYLRATYDDFIQFIMEHTDGKPYNVDTISDQGAYLDFYSHSVKFLHRSFNVKPYWDIPIQDFESKKILHFHGPKPHQYVGTMMGLPCPEASNFICDQNSGMKHICPSLQTFSVAILKQGTSLLKSYCKSAFHNLKSDSYEEACVMIFHELLVNPVCDLHGLETSIKDLFHFSNVKERNRLLGTSAITLSVYLLFILVICFLLISPSFVRKVRKVEKLLPSDSRHMSSNGNEKRLQDKKLIKLLHSRRVQLFLVIGFCMNWAFTMSMNIRLLDSQSFLFSNNVAGVDERSKLSLNLNPESYPCNWCWGPGYPGYGEGLWKGDVMGGNTFSFNKIKIVLSYCNHDISWLQSFTKGFDIESVTIVSKCNKATSSSIKKTSEIIEYLPNVGRCDHSYAHWLDENVDELGDNEIVVFLKDNRDVHQYGYSRGLGEMLRIASITGFSCGQKPSNIIDDETSASQFHLSRLQDTFSMKSYPREEKTHNNEIFASKYDNMGNWLENLNITVSKPFMPICYGGIFAASSDNLKSVDRSIWPRLKRSLSRGDNIEEGHFTERLWAALVSKRLTENQVVALGAYANRIASELDGIWGYYIGGLGYQQSLDEEEDEE